MLERIITNGISLDSLPVDSRQEFYSNIFTGNRQILFALSIEEVAEPSGNIGIRNIVELSDQAYKPRDRR